MIDIKYCNNIVIKEREDENIPNLYILPIICFSERGPSKRINLTNVIGACLSLEASRLKSSLRIIGLDFNCLCSTILLTLLKNKNEFIIAGSKAIIAIISDLEIIAKEP
jgi:hypothetical protein